MAVKKVCNTNVITIEKDATLREAVRLMSLKHVGSVVVTESRGENKFPVGVITDRDIALALDTSDSPLVMKVEVVMQSHPITINAEDGIYDTILKMQAHGVKRMPVLNNDGALYGLVSADDLLSLMGEEINSLSKITHNQMMNERGVRLPVEGKPPGFYR
jgi:CBS domain-containing protein